MSFEIGQPAALCGLIGAVLALIDWLMPEDRKRQLANDLRKFLADRSQLGMQLTKAPITVLHRVLSSSLENTNAGKLSWKRTSLVSSLLLAACLVCAGIASGTVLGFEESPSDAYRKEIQYFEKAFKDENSDEELTEEEAAEVALHQEDVRRIIETAKHPFARLAAIVIVSFLITSTSLFFTNIALAYTARTMKSLSTNDDGVLIVGAAVLNTIIAVAVFLLELVALSVITSIVILFIFSFVGILLGLGPAWGTALFVSYAAISWVTAPVWLKALATASLVPMVLMYLSVGVTLLIFPMRKHIALILSFLGRRAAGYKSGPVAFFATAFALLAAAITAATGLIN